MQPWKYWEDKSKPFPGRSRDWLRRYLLHAREPSVPPWLETREFPLHDQGLGWTSHGAYANLLISVSDRCGWPLGCSGFSGGAYWNFRCCFSQTLGIPCRLHSFIRTVRVAKSSAQNHVIHAEFSCQEANFVRPQTPPRGTHPAGSSGPCSDDISLWNGIIGTQMEAHIGFVAVPLHFLIGFRKFKKFRKFIKFKKIREFRKFKKIREFRKIKKYRKFRQFSALQKIQG